MQPPHEPPLSQRELQVVRGMIDEHRDRLRRHGYWRSLFGDARVLLLAVGVACSTALQVMALLRRHG